MKRFYLMLAVVLMGTGNVNIQVQAETVAERLGYPADAKLVLLHGDDIGMCHAANTSAIKAFEAGMMKSGSVMVPCPWFLEIAQYAREHPEADLGLHLTLTSEWKHYRWRPLADTEKVRGLIDEQGYMHRGVRDVYEHATPQEAEAEIRAQIEHALKHGMKPTHLDSHMGTLYYNPEFFKTVIALSEEYDIPFMLIEPSDENVQEMGEERIKPYMAIVNSMRERGVPVLDGLLAIPDGTPVAEMKEAYKKLIAEVQPGLYEIILHLADESEEYRAITGSYPRRLEEFKIFTDPEMKKFIEEQGVILIGWKELYPLWKGRKR